MLRTILHHLLPDADGVAMENIFTNSAYLSIEPDDIDENQVQETAFAAASSSRQLLEVDEATRILMAATSAYGVLCCVDYQLSCLNDKSSSKLNVDSRSLPLSSVSRVQLAGTLHNTHAVSIIISFSSS